MGLLADRRLHRLLVLGALLRLLIGLNLWKSDPTMAALLSDSSYYRDWALALRGGADFPFEGPELAYWMPPLYAWLLALIGASVKLAVLIQGVIGLVTTILIVALGEQLLRGAFKTESEVRKAALLGGLLWTLYGPVIFFEGRLLGASFATLLGAAALLMVLIWKERGTAKYLVLAGLALGLMSLTRPNTLLALPALAVWLGLVARNGERGVLGSWAKLLVPALLVLTPALVHNAKATGGFVPITVNGGVNFFFGNNPQSHGTFHAPGIEWGSIREQRATAKMLAGASTDTKASGFWFREGLAFLLDSPVEATRLWGLKLADLGSSTEFGIQYNFAAARSVAPSLWLVSLPFGVLLLFVAAGWRRAGSGVVIAWLMAGIFSALLYFTYSRFRLPILPALMPFAGAGLLRLLTHKARPTAVFAGLMLCAFSFIAFEGSYPRHLRSHAFQDMAAAIEPAPATRERRAALLDRAIDLVPGNKPARTARAIIARNAGKHVDALVHLEAAAALPVEYPQTELELAKLLAASDDLEVVDIARAKRIVSTWLAGHDEKHAYTPAFSQLAGLLGL